MNSPTFHYNVLRLELYFIRFAALGLKDIYVKVD